MSASESQVSKPQLAGPPQGGDAHRVPGRAPALRRAAGIEDLEGAIAVSLEQGQVRVAEYHGVDLREAATQPAEPATCRTGVVDEGDPRSSHVHLGARRQALAEGPVVDVAVHGDQWRADRAIPS